MGLNRPIKIVQLTDTLVQLMNIFSGSMYLPVLGLLLNLLHLGLIECSSNKKSGSGKGNSGGSGKDNSNDREDSLRPNFRKPRSKSLTDYSLSSRSDKQPRDGLRRMNIIMPSEEETRAARLEAQAASSSSSDDTPPVKGGPPVTYAGVFDDVKYRIHILQLVDKGEPELSSYQYFPGSPITRDTIRRAKLQRKLDNAHKDPRKFLCADSSSSSNSDSSSSEEIDYSDPKVGADQYMRRRGSSLGAFPEKKSRKAREAERIWDMYRQEDLKKEAQLAKKKEKAAKKREKERLKEQRESESRDEKSKGDRKKK